MMTFNRLLVILLSTALGVATAHAQATQKPTSGADRLFLAFDRDAAIVPNQWWEGLFEVADDGVDASVASLVVALQPYERLEVGGKIGFGDTDTPPGVPDGSGATDLDVYGKWSLGTVGETGDTEVSVGGLLTVPTGDDTAALGQDSFGVGVFGAVRHRLPEAILAAHAGLRFNEDGRSRLVSLDGKTSVLLGVGVIVPITDRLSAVGEVEFESERFERFDDDSRILGGVNWRLTNRGMFRGALAVGIADGAPDTQVIVGYAYVL